MKGSTYLLCIIALFIIVLSLSKVEAKDIQTQIRQDRLLACQEEYEKSDLQIETIYGQDLIVRCATYMTLIYAYESGFGKSNKCMTMNNCWGMKGNGYNHPSGFITFDSYGDGRRWLANRYFRFHYKKKIYTMVTTWSMTDHNTYIAFMTKNYWTVFNELYFLNK